MYINRGQFGKFVTKIIELKQKEEKEKLEHDDDWKLWLMYTRILPDKSFRDWKEDLRKEQPRQSNGNNRDADLTEEDIQNIINDLFPE